MTPIFHDLQHRQVRVDDASIHVVESGPPGAASILFIHGWPENWAIYERLMQLLHDTVHVVAIDLPGIGLSATPAASNDKRTLARFVERTISALGLQDVTLVGHDIGGQIVYACLHAGRCNLKRAVIMDVAVPGVDPWPEILRNPRIWHFAFHAVPGLPEKMVADHVAEYFGFFHDALSGPAGVSQEVRREFVQAYSAPAALHTGFEWYRAFAQDAKDNLSVKDQPVATPVLYVRGDHEPGNMQVYVRGLQDSGLRDVRPVIIPNAGHFAPHEQPEAIAAALREFIDSTC
jgi:pimeloyl-ACP methyl ester carboxylesterase